MGLDEFTDDDAPDPKPKGKRQLPWLPDYGAPLGEMRDWLTVALGFPPGFFVEDFIRHGRGRTDPCVLVMSTPGGGSIEYEIDEQRMLSSASIRSTITSITDGLARMRSLTKAEYEDVWTALVTLATITVRQTQTDETRDWLDRFLRATTELTGYTLEGADQQFEALQAIRERPTFTRNAAANVAALGDYERPVQFVDAQTSRRYTRASDAATFVRHAINAGPVSQGTLNGRMAGIGIEVLTLEVRRADTHPRLVLYRLPQEPPE